MIRKQPLSGVFEGLEATFVEVIFEPGQSSKPHKHPGFVLGYVLEGKFRFAVKGGKEQILGPGEVFYLNYAQIRRSHRRWSCGDSGTRVNSVISQVVFSAVSLPV